MLRRHQETPGDTRRHQETLGHFLELDSDISAGWRRIPSSMRTLRSCQEALNFGPSVHRTIGPWVHVESIFEIFWHDVMMLYVYIYSYICIMSMSKGTAFVSQVLRSWVQRRCSVFQPSASGFPWLESSAVQGVNVITFRYLKETKPRASVRSQV